MTEEVKKSSKLTRLSPLQWAEAEAKWKSGEYTLSMLEEEYGLRVETFSRYFKKKGIVKGSDSVGELVRESLKSDAEMRARARAEKIEDRRSTYDKWAHMLAQIAIVEITKAKTTKTPLSSIEDELKTIQRASAIIQKSFDVSSRALGIEKEETVGDEIPNLLFGELTQKQVEELKKLDEGASVGDEEEALMEALEDELYESDSDETDDEDDGVD
ncbi:TPA: DNA-binding protein [Raoultella ornithinolytica]